jgi:hypothetical protein
MSAVPPSGICPSGEDRRDAHRDIGPYAQFVDDAALFPPGSAAMADALSAHAGYQRTWFADLVGPMLCPTARLGDLVAGLDAENEDGTSLELVLVGDQDSLVAACAEAGNDPRLVVRGLESTLSGGRDLRAEVAAALPALIAACESSCAQDGEPTRRGEVLCKVEVPRTAAWLEAVGAIAAGAPEFDEPGCRRLAVTLRTGGVQAPAFPSEAEVAAFICRCVSGGLRFSCKGGLHHAVRHHDDRTGLEHHGFLNVLVGTGLALSGGVVADVAEVISERRPEVLADAVQGFDAGSDGLARVRRSFLSFASCSVAEPLADLDGLGLL